MPTVSVIVPNFNHEKYLNTRLESIFAQTYQDFEVIILDDCSTDNSRELLEKYRNHPKVVNIEYNTTNSGSPFKQWNKGISMSCGKYIWIAESDDVAHPELLENLVEYLDNDAKLGLAYVQSKIIDKHGKSSGLSDQWTNVFSKTKWKKNYRESGIFECASCLALGNTIPNASAVLFRKDIYLKTGGADESMRVCGDWVAWLRILSVSDLQFHAEPLNEHRYHCITARKTSDKKIIINEFEKARKIGSEIDKPRFQTQKQIKEEAWVHVRFWSSELEKPFTFRKLYALLKSYPFMGYSFIVCAVILYVKCRIFVYYNRFRILFGYWKTQIFSK